MVLGKCYYPQGRISTFHLGGRVLQKAWRHPAQLHSSLAYSSCYLQSASSSCSKTGSFLSWELCWYFNTYHNCSYACDHGLHLWQFIRKAHSQLSVLIKGIKWIFCFAFCTAWLLCRFVAFAHSSYLQQDANTSWKFPQKWHWCSIPLYHLNSPGV